MAEDVDGAAARLASASRVLVIGCSGSGKSTLAARLSGMLDLPHVPMDREIFWLPGWQPRPRAEALARLGQVVGEPRWIMDGTSPGTLSLRLPRTDLVLWLRPPRWKSIRGVFARWLRYRGRSRPAMAEGCPERLNLEFLRYIWNFERTESPEIKERLGEYPSVPVVVLRSYAQNERLVQALSDRLCVDRKGQDGIQGLAAFWPGQPFTTRPNPKSFGGNGAPT